MNNKLPFTVPAGYFEQFSAQMESQIALQVVMPNRHRFLRVWYSVAAAVAALIIVGGFMSNSHQQKLAQQQDLYETYLMAQIGYADVMDFYANAE